jgi:hypothetical protein
MLMEGWRSPMPGRWKSRPLGLSWLGVALVSRFASASLNAEARGRLEVHGRGRLGHGVQGAVLLRALGEEGEAAIARVLKQDVAVGQVAGHKLVRLAVPGVGEARTRARVLGAAKVWQGGLLDGRADGRARGGRLSRRVGEGRRRGLVGIQLHGGCGVGGTVSVGWVVEGGTATWLVRSEVTRDDCVAACVPRLEPVNVAMGEHCGRG